MPEESTLEIVYIDVGVRDTGVEGDLRSIAAKTARQVQDPTLQPKIRVGATFTGAAELQRLEAELRGLTSQYRVAGGDTKALSEDIRGLIQKTQALRPAIDDDTRAFSRYSTFIERAASKTEQLEGRVSKLSYANQINMGVQQQVIGQLSQFGPVGRVAESSLSSMGIAAGGIAAPALLATGAVVGLSVAAADLRRRGLPQLKEFQAAMNTLEASGVEDLNAVSEAIRRVQEESGKAGRQFNRAEIATAIAETVKANRSEAESLELLKGSLQLAAAEGDNLNDSTLNLSANMRVFGISTDQAQVVASKFVVAGNLAQKEAKDFSVGLNAVGNSAKIAGFDLDQTLGILVALDNNGLDPAQEGARAFRAIIAGLADPSQKARDILASINVELKDSEGRTRQSKDVFFELVAALNKTEQQGGSAKDVLNGLVQELNNNAEAGATAFGLFDTLGANAVLGLGDNVDTLTGKIRASGDELFDYTNTKLKGLGPAEKEASKALDDLGATFVSLTAGPAADFDIFLAGMIRKLDSALPRVATLFSALADFGKLTTDPTALLTFTPDKYKQAPVQSVETSFFDESLLGRPAAPTPKETAVTAAYVQTLAGLRKAREALIDQREQLVAGDQAGADALNAQIESYDKQIRALEGVETSSKRTARATLSDEAKRQQAILETKQAYQSGLTAINTEFTLTGDRSKALSDQLRLTETTAKKLLELGYQGSGLQALLDDIGTVALQSLFADLGAAGTLANKQAAAFGNTLDARLTSAQARVGLLETALKDAVAIDAPPDALQNLLDRLATARGDVTDLSAELGRLQRNADRRVATQNRLGDDTTPSPTLTQAEVAAPVAISGSVYDPSTGNYKVVLEPTVSVAAAVPVTGSVYDPSTGTYKAVVTPTVTVAKPVAIAGSVYDESTGTYKIVLEPTAMVAKPVNIPVPEVSATAGQSVKLVAPKVTARLIDEYQTLLSSATGRTLAFTEAQARLGRVSKQVVDTELRNQEATLTTLLGTIPEGTDAWLKYASALADVRGRLKDIDLRPLTALLNGNVSGLSDLDLTNLASQGALMLGPGGNASIPDFRAGYSPFAVEQRKDAAEAAEQQRAAAEQFASTVVSAGAGFAQEAIQGIIDGDVAGIVRSAFSAGSSILGQADLGSVGGFGVSSLVSAGLGIFGGLAGLIFGGGAGRDDARRSNEEQRRSSSVPAITISFDVVQNNNYSGGPRDPASEQAYSRNVDELAGAVLRNILPRLDKLEART